MVFLILSMEACASLEFLFFGFFFLFFFLKWRLDVIMLTEEVEMLDVEAYKMCEAEF